MASIVSIEVDGTSEGLQFVSGDSPGFSESWIQELVFDHPELIPGQLLESDTDRFIPFCRELPLSAGGPGVFLDVMGATTSGTPVLIECKLWKNPQARREVIGQILEYSALLQGMSYEDLVALCRRRLGTQEPDPVLAAARRAHPDLDEARFVDRLAAGLEGGDFVLIVAGDGIRADVRRVVDQLRRNGGSFRRFGLLELKVARGANGRTVVVPLVPFEADRAEVGLADRAQEPPLDSVDGTHESDGPARKVDPEKKKADREFWDRFIAQAVFDYSDQSPPYHGGRNTARIALPAPLRDVRAYRARNPGQLGVYVNFVGEDSMALYNLLRDDEDELKAEISEDLVFGEATDRPAGHITVSRAFEIEDPETEAEQIRWFIDMCNRFVNALRPRISRESHG